MDKNSRDFYINFNFITMVYPREINTIVKDFGVLEKYRGNKYTLKEISDIISEMVSRIPYIPNSMEIKLSVMKGRGYHHILIFRNYNYKSQERENARTIGFLDI